MASLFTHIARRFQSTLKPNTIQYVRDELQRHVSAVMKMPPNSGKTILEPRTMNESKALAVIPLASDKSMQLQYINWRQLVRFGVILEDLDTFAAYLVYRHNQGGAPMAEPNHQPMSIVTACVDNIQISEDHNITPDWDIYMAGNVSWVGKSSIEVSMELWQDVNGQRSDYLKATFVMVARNPSATRSLPLAPLKITSVEEEELFERGETARKMRKMNEARSLLKFPPNEAERSLLHDMFVKTLDPKNLSFRRRILPPNHKWIEDSKLKNAVLCFPSQRSVYNKIFGGFIMRMAFELAWTNASMYSKHRVDIVAVDDINFKNPVEIGDILLLSSQVCFTSGRRMELSVNVEVLEVETGNRKITNTFYFTFLSQADVPTVVPRSYADGMLFISAKRRFDSALARS
ncbi:Acyl-coenzyme A thioesterase 9, mitochondrial [Toxocara canis]|uniref:Acyl-coenzyme A thioesterase 9, mitochondrial n=1 Tax=Toxocara canis TaxID=6265 RepID=A0A0B2VS01_TOXCA|nr:Acyl-coenzyme A thioesterase 9, mitochondrial [Toxocara canis]